MEFVDHCEITQVHQGAVDQVRQVLPPDEVLSDLADLFKICLLYTSRLSIPPGYGQPLLL